MKVMKAKSRIYSVTWTCRRCGAVFLTEAQWAIHMLTCGSVSRVFASL